MSLGIRHIEILVSDLEKSIEFYSKLLSLIGWKQVDFYDPDGYILEVAHKK